jgi:hypothetical protein
MQLDPVATGAGKPFMGDGVEARGMLLKGSLEDARLLRRWVQVYHNGSLHAKRISYTPT